MISSVYNSVSGLSAHQQALDQIAHNLANVNTTAYKQSETVFGDLLYQSLRDQRMAVARPEGVPEVQTGQGVRVVATTPAYWEQGAMVLTQRPFDLAIDGKGFFQIELPEGEMAYTRAGSFSLDAAGRLVTAAGYHLSAPFTLEGVRPETITVTPEGLVSALDESGAPVELGTLHLHYFINPEGLNQSRGCLFLETEVSGPPAEGAPGQNGLGRLRQCCLEQSTVSLAREMTLLLIQHRSIQAAARCLVTATELQRLTVQVNP